MRDFLAAVKNRGKPVADIEQGHISTASCILANVSMQLGRALAYDPAAKQVVGDARGDAAAPPPVPRRLPAPGGMKQAARCGRFRFWGPKSNVVGCPFS